MVGKLYNGEKHYPRELFILHHIVAVLELKEGYNNCGILDDIFQSSCEWPLLQKLYHPPTADGFL